MQGTVLAGLKCSVSNRHHRKTVPRKYTTPSNYSKSRVELQSVAQLTELLVSFQISYSIFHIQANTYITVILCVSTRPQYATGMVSPSDSTRMFSPPGSMRMFMFSPSSSTRLASLPDSTRMFQPPRFYKNVQPLRFNEDGQPSRF